ncbi:tetratricopeptide repeat protein [Chloroflexota bacterium]
MTTGLLFGGQTNRAIADYAKAIEIDPYHGLPYNNRGNVYVEQGEYDKAIADYTKAIEIDPYHGLPYNNRGEAYITMGQYDLAIVDMNKAAELDRVIYHLDCHGVCPLESIIGSW